MTAPRLDAGSLAHAPLMAALHGQCFAEQGTEPWTDKAMADLLGMPGAFALIAVDGETPVGFILCRTAADEAEVITLGVVPSARGRGIAGRLLDAAVERSRGARAGRLFLEVAEDNVAARALYAARGFTEAGRRPGYYARGATAVDALVLALTLS